MGVGLEKEKMGICLIRILALSVWYEEDPVAIPLSRLILANALYGLEPLWT